MGDYSLIYIVVADKFFCARPLLFQTLHPVILNNKLLIINAEGKLFLSRQLGKRNLSDNLLDNLVAIEAVAFICADCSAVSSLNFICLSVFSVSQYRFLFLSNSVLFEFYFQPLCIFPTSCPIFPTRFHGRFFLRCLIASFRSIAEWSLFS